MSEYIELETAYDYATLEDWYQNSILDTNPPVWTDEHLEELLNDFYVIPKDTPVINIVMCNNCENGIIRKSKSFHYIWCRKWDTIMRDCDFCSGGERKKNNEE